MVLSLVLFVGTHESFAGRIKQLFRVLDDLPFASSAIVQRASHIKALVHKQRIDLPANGVKAVVKDTAQDLAQSSSQSVGSAAVRQVSEAVQKAAAPATYGLSINPSEADATVRIMNIGPKYRDGIQLAGGDYKIAVEKDGFRPKMFWVTLGSDAGRDAYRFDVELQPVGLENCEQNLELQRYNSGLAGTDGRLLQYKARFENTNIHDLYYSFAQYRQSLNSTKLLHDRVSLNYAEFHMAQPTQLTADDIKYNRKVEIDPDRFILLIYSFEQVGNDVIVANKALMPKGVFVVDASKKWLCENEFDF